MLLASPLLSEHRVRTTGVSRCRLGRPGRSPWVAARQPAGPALSGWPSRTSDYRGRVPSTGQAALVFLVAVVPGFLALAGYRLGRAVPAQPEGLVTTARVITVSAFIAIVAWRFGGKDVYDDVRAGTALMNHEAHTYYFTLALLLVPGVTGFLLAQLVDAMTHRVWTARNNLPAPPRPDSPKEPFPLRAWRKCLVALSARLLHDGPTTWDRTWKQVRRTQPYVFVRVTTRGGRVIVGTVADTSRIAVSPQPRDLYIEQTLQAEDGTFYPTRFGLGAFIAGTEIETVEWVSQQGVVTHDPAADTADH
jgi:hypothetical protein